MSIYKKTLLIIGLTLGGLIFVLSIIVPTLLLQSFSEVEELSIRQKIETISRTFEKNLEDFTSKLYDWSSWDDAYAFIVNRNSQFVASNITYDGLKSINIDIMLFVNSSGEVVFETALDRQNKILAPITGEVKTAVMSASKLLDGADIKKKISGYLCFQSSQPLIISARPILNSQGEGPSRGSLVFGRHLDESEMEKFRAVSAPDLTLKQFNDENPGDDFVIARLHLYGAEKIFIQTLNDSYIAGYTVLNDIYQKPSMILGSKFKRVIYEQGKKSVYYFILILWGVIFISGALALSLLNEFVIKRLDRLGVEVGKIGAKKDFSARVAMTGNDEFTDLAFEINSMLGSLENSRHELQEALMNLDVANRAKNDFLSNMSHEIRTPMTPMIGYTDLLWDTSLSDEQREFLQRVRSSSNILLSTINDILDYSKIESGELELDMTDFQVDMAVIESVGVAKHSADLKNIRLITNVDKKSSERVTGDCARVKQILTNLISNAVKYTNSGDINIDVKASGEDDISISFDFSVADRGIGISEDKQVAIFLPFVQGDGSSTRRHGGTGLGLTISDRLVKLMGGERIFIQSKAGAGSRFYFTIKFEKFKNIDQDEKSES